MNCFYEPQFDSSDITGLNIPLSSDESWHCAKVLRMREGETIRITNGKGWFYKAVLKVVDPKRCEVQITESLRAEARNYSIHIAVAPVKNMVRFEWFLEKATELGIDQITPLICERSEKISVRTDRLNKIMVAAIKQSLGVTMPVIDQPQKFNDFIKQETSALRYIAWMDTKNKNLLSQVCPSGNNIIVLIGPEGDFSETEVMNAKSAGYIPISLGNNRLRTETAALAATMAIHFANKAI